jgi:hypothetical protein
MWAQVQKLIHSTPEETPKSANAYALPPVLPLRSQALPLEKLATGSVVSFSSHCPLPEFVGRQAQVIAVRHYQFGDEKLKNYQLQLGEAKHFFLTIAEDDQGHYISLSRALSEAEQDRWFGRDALSFFTESSTAKTIRCKADLAIEGAWMADRYSKSVDWVEGSISSQALSRMARRFHYNLLMDVSGEKALEIEHDDESGENRVFVTVYRPITDIFSIEEEKSSPIKAPRMEAEKPAAMTAAAPVPTANEVPLFKEPVESQAQQLKQRTDFRRLVETQAEEIRIARHEALKHVPIAMPDEPEHALPSFLLERPGDYLSLDEVIPPDAERVRVGLKAARTLIDRAISKNVRVRDVLRDMLGLDSVMADEVIFELPLSDDDYRKLAMRFKLRADHRDEIRARLQEELRKQLLK